MEERKKIIIEPGKGGVVYEDYKEYEKSLFKNVYDKAAVLTKKIVDENRKLRNSDAHGNDFRNKEQFNNTICFIGRRGTGKTSSMLSFVEGLKDHHKEYSVVEDKERCLHFIGLDWIDASLIEKNEEIFDMILAKMFAEVLRMNKEMYGARKFDFDYDNRLLQQQFEKIYRHFNGLKKRENGYEEEAALSALSDRARSTQVRTDFAELVRLYIRFCEAAKDMERGKETYLVIAIDDIDLNLEKGYDILEQIHRYLMVPGLIVLIAINYEDMSMLCQKRYVEAYEKLENRTIVDLGKRVMRMSENYLEKILPIYMRVYMPSLKKTDYDLSDERLLRIDGMELPIKQAMFYLIWKKTGIFYDACGEKRHFWEPETLRNLNGFYSVYTQMEDLPDSTDAKFPEIYEKNYYKIIDDIIFRYAYEHLPYKEYELFIKWSEEKIIRRGQGIIAEVKEMLQEDKFEVSSFFAGRAKSNDDKEMLKKFEDSYEQSSYDGLLRALYWISHKSLYDKRLVHLLLAQYTVVFSKVFVEYKREICAEGKQGYINRDKLEELIGTSIGKNWGRYILKPEREQSDNNLLILQYSKKDNKVPAWRRLRESGEKGWAACKEYLLSEELDSARVAIMALIECYSEGINLEITKDDGGEIEFGLKLKSSSEIELNPLGFLENSFDYDANLDWVNKLIIKALKKYELLESNDCIDVWIAELREAELKNEESLRSRYQAWYRETGGLALPIYNFDITYNLFKRLIRDFKCVESTYYKKMKAMYAWISKKLGQQDEYYNEKISYEYKISDLQSIFIRCPIVDAVLQSDETKYEEVIQRMSGEWDKYTDSKTVENALQDV